MEKDFLVGFVNSERKAYNVDDDDDAGPERDNSRNRVFVFWSFSDSVTKLA